MPNERTICRPADPVYDEAGNMTTMPQPVSPTSTFTLTYDAWNRLVVVSDTGGTVSAMEYDGLGRRIRRVNAAADPDVTYDYYYNQQWQLLEEHKDGSVYPLAQYFWNPYYVDSLALRYYDENADGLGQTPHYYLQDANFNVTAVVNSSATVLERYQYTPYGEVTILDDDFVPDSNQISDIGNTHLYTGRERDPETGLQLNRRRYYASHLGRWLTRDPIGYDGSQWNLYEYVQGRPLRYLDPNGLGLWDWIKWGLRIDAAKDLCDCKWFLDEKEKADDKCRKMSDEDQIKFILDSTKKCPNQISPLFPVGSLKHAELCCEVTEARKNLTKEEFEKFLEGYATCLKGVGKTIRFVPRPTP